MRVHSRHGVLGPMMTSCGLSSGHKPQAIFHPLFAKLNMLRQNFLQHTGVHHYYQQTFF